MRFYNKYYANDFEELLTYYPRFYRGVYEMVEILKAQGKLADELEADIEQIYFNCFIDYADEPTLTKLERFLDIGLNKSRTLEERRRLVKSYFVGFGKVSATVICQMISAYTNATVRCRLKPFDKEKNNALMINMERGNEVFFDMGELISLLRRKVPAHIIVNILLNYKPEKPADLKLFAFSSAGNSLKIKAHLESSLVAKKANILISSRYYYGSILKVKPLLF